MPFTVAIVGRPNVGKSTLFNRLVGRRLAVVHDTPGVTRDRREGQGRIADLEFRVIDTAGLEEGGGDSLEARTRAQTGCAVEGADVVLLLIDARAGLTPLDRHFADALRGTDRPVIAVANKCEGHTGEVGFYEAYSLGCGDPVPISAMNGDGLADLYEVLAPLAGREELAADGAPLEGGNEAAPGRILLAIVGRPNVGKSTLANQLVGEERMLTGPEPGLTRDAVPLDWSHGGRPITLVDTAGLRRRARVTDQLETLSARESERAIRRANLVVLVLDAREMLHRQELSIARMVEDEGRALVIAANKWDLVGDRGGALDRLRDRLETSLPQLKGVPFVTVSALEGQGLDQLMAAVFRAEELWNKRIPTGPLNRWLEGVLAHHPPPLAAGRRVRLRYITQVKARPPSFALFVNLPSDLPDSYVRYLANALREDFDLPGVPIRLRARKGRNPYVED
jgi:GTP-binding protein